MEQRELGRTGAKLSVIGFGGIIVTSATPEEADRFVGEAVDAGVTYFDVAPSYGNAEERLGPAIERYRDRVFLACKTEKRGRDEAAKSLQQSLKRLHTDHFDLFQLHGLTSEDDAKQAFAKGGAMEVLIEAKQQGVLQHLGFSAHSEPAALLAMSQYDFDSVLFPVNYFAWNRGHFGQQIMAEAQRRGVARLALKAMALGRFKPGEPKQWQKAWYQPLQDPELASLAVRWTLSQPITAAVTPGHIELLRLAVKAVQDLSVPSAGELERLAALLGDRAPVFPG